MLKSGDMSIQQSQLPIVDPSTNAVGEHSNVHFRNTDVHFSNQGHSSQLPSSLSSYSKVGINELNLNLSLNILEKLIVVRLILVTSFMRIFDII